MRTSTTLSRSCAAVSIGGEQRSHSPPRPTRRALGAGVYGSSSTARMYSAARPEQIDHLSKCTTPVTFRQMNPHGTQENQIEIKTGSRDQAQCWQKVINLVDRWVVMQGNCDSPLGSRRFNSDHITTIGSQARCITTATYRPTTASASASY